MPNYNMNLQGELGLNEYSNIFDYISVVDSGDNFTITLNEEAKNSVKVISSMLRDKEFSIIDEGINSLGGYYISANKQK
ncbi:hypothetical protein [Clostridium sp.]|uniref:hypothetical protein n=1 Tax=Clostridium sp. TaxID=1506 RepID=UPI003F3E59C5